MFPCYSHPFAAHSAHNALPENDWSSTPVSSPPASQKNAKLQLRKTELCHFWEEQGECRRGDTCWFAHGYDELRPVQRRPEYKTKECASFVQTGSCNYGKRCTYIHPRHGDANICGRDATRVGSLLSRVGICQAPPPTKCSFFSEPANIALIPAKTNWSMVAAPPHPFVANAAAPATRSSTLPAVTMTKQPQAHAPMLVGPDLSSSFGSTRSSLSSSSDVTMEHFGPHTPMRSGSFDLMPGNLLGGLSPGDQEIMYNILLSNAVARSHMQAPLDGASYNSAYNTQPHHRQVASTPPSPLEARSSNTWGPAPSYTKEALQGYFFHK